MELIDDVGSDLWATIERQMGAVDDGTVETALLNYLFAKQIMARLRTNSNPYDLIQKRSYWKQCTFNAVSCFGK